MCVYDFRKQILLRLVVQINRHFEKLSRVEKLDFFFTNSIHFKTEEKTQE